MKKLLAALLVVCVVIGCATISDAGATNRLKKQINIAVAVINSLIADAKIFASREDIEDIKKFQEKFALVAESIQTKVDLIMALYVPLGNEEAAMYAIESTRPLKVEMVSFSSASKATTLRSMRRILRIYEGYSAPVVLEVLEIPDEN